MNNQESRSNQLDMSYYVDMVFCIDVTGSMQPILDTVKKNALNFYADVATIMENKGKTISQLRVRVVAFRDYLADDEPMLVTDFFYFPEQAAQFRDCISSLRATGGGDVPEDGLEALAYAMKTKWTTEGMKTRQIIAVWTDAPTHEIGHGSASPNYPKSLPKSFEELTEWWGYGQTPGYMDANAKRLVLFAPDEAYWSTITDSWDNVVHFPSKGGEGLEEVDYGTIVNMIANSI